MSVMVEGSTSVEDVGVVPAFMMNAYVFRDLLTGALVGTGRDKTMPTLTGVLVEWGDGDRVRMVSTDRYRLVLGVSDVEGMGVGRVLVQRDDVAALVKALPKMLTKGSLSPHDPVVSFTVVSEDAVVVRFDGPGVGSWSREIPLLVGEFPKYRTLIPTEDRFGPVDGVSWNPDYLAAVADIPHERNVPVSWRFVAADRPAVATYPEWHGISWTYLLMPVRLTR